MERFQIIGHRGVPCDAPENSLSSFRRAAELNLEAIECDIRMTCDGHLVLMHDRTVDRTTDGTGEVSCLPLDSIAKLDCGSWFDVAYAGERVPTLEQLLDAVDEDMHLILELKETHRWRAATDQVLELIQEREMVDRVTLTSFYWDPLQRVRHVEPGMQIQALVASLRDDSTNVDPGIGPEHIAYGSLRELLSDPRLTLVDTVCPGADEVSEELVKSLHARGLSVRTWGARTDCRCEIERILRSGADGMTADYPAFARSVCDEWYESR